MSRFAALIVASVMSLGAVATAHAQDPDVRQRLVSAPASAQTEFPIVWPSRPPDDCPFEQSTELTGAVFPYFYASIDFVVAAVASFRAGMVAPDVCKVPEFFEILISIFPGVMNTRQTLIKTTSRLGVQKDDSVSSLK